MGWFESTIPKSWNNGRQPYTTFAAITTVQYTSATSAPATRPIDCNGFFSMSNLRLNHWKPIAHLVWPSCRRRDPRDSWPLVLEGPAFRSEGNRTLEG